MAHKFPLGQTVITNAAELTINPPDVLLCLNRHGACDWGELDEEDKASNDAALTNEGRLLSAYTDQNGAKFWIITEHDRSVTTVLLPEDY